MRFVVRILALAVSAFTIGLMLNWFGRQFIPELTAECPTIPLMLVIVAGVRLGTVIAMYRQGPLVDDHIALACGFLSAGIWLMHSLTAILWLVPVLLVYTLGFIPMHKRHHPEAWPKPDPYRFIKATQPKPWKPLLGIRPVSRNPDGSY